MTVKISKPALNLREELNKLDKPSGITGETLLRADTDAEARATLGIDNFEQVSVSTDGVISADGLTSSGNLLVGKTASSVSTDGVELISSGFTRATVNGDTVLQLNRRTSDGTIINFRKDGTTVGSIASDGGSNLIVKGQGNNAALLFNHTNARIEPYTSSVTDLGRSAAKFKDLYLSGNVSAGAVSQVFTLSDRGYFVAGTSNSSNQHLYLGSYHGSTLKELVFSGSNSSLYPKTTASINLGLSTHKFKELYLSGGVYLGGTGAANKLDDYEEGTWTPSFSGSGYSFSGQVGTYTKIGRQVFVRCEFTITTVGANTSNISYSGLPFTASNAITNGHFIGTVRETQSNGAMFVAQVSSGSSGGGVNAMDGITSGDNHVFTADRYGLCVTYEV